MSPLATNPASPAGELARQQLQFKQAVTGLDTPSDDDAAGLLRHQPGREPLLRVYRHAYTSRLAGALRDNFGVLPQVMGDEAFDTLAQAYVAARPSQHPSIRWFGDGLPDFMAAHDDLVPHPALTDLARMEWALRGAFDAADAPPLEATALAAAPPDAWGELVLVFHPSVRLLPMQWGVEPLWRALQGVEPGDEPDLPEPEEAAHTLLVWRPALEPLWRSAASDTEAELLQAAWDGEAFGLLCERAARHVGEEQAAATAVAALQQWVGEGLLAGWR
jgi:hypothetical protein